MPTANGDRVVQNLRQLAELGKYKTGVHRPTLFAASTCSRCIG